ncbi:NAD(P)/FAD-dependent oxidoreductase, partial [Nitrospinota bacterium]
AMITHRGSCEADETLARRGAEFIRKPPPGWPRSLNFSPTGSLFLASGEALEEQELIAGRLRAAGVDAHMQSQTWVAEKIPILEGCEFESALWCPSDGVVDIQALLEGFLEGAQAGGAELWMDCELKTAQVRNGRVALAETSQGRVETEFFIDAAGAWSGAVAEMAGAARLPLRPCRRHLFRTGTLSWVDPEWPLVWDTTGSYYFRPEADGLLLSPCDEDEHPPSLPEADSAARALLVEKLRRWVPPLQWLRYEASWACLRTLTPDNRFVIGWDPLVQDFFWVAGLGGHGATCSATVGEMAARLILGRQDSPDPNFAPERLVSTSPS